jgi:hypothetical protein
MGHASALTAFRANGLPVSTPTTVMVTSCAAHEGQKHTQRSIAKVGNPKIRQTDLNFVTDAPWPMSMDSRHMVVSHLYALFQCR